jgi:mxaJ protein
MRSLFLSGALSVALIAVLASAELKRDTASRGASFDAARVHDQAPPSYARADEPATGLVRSGEPAPSAVAASDVAAGAVAASAMMPGVDRAPGATMPGVAGPPLRVCADPNNLPFSNSAGEGFENRLAELVAESFGTRVQYTWWAQRRGFFRNTLKAGACDLVVGVPSALDMLLTTAPYYRSIYVFVTASDRSLDIRSLDDARLKELRVGVQLVGDDGANTPPAHALARRGIVGNVVGFTLYGDYREPSPPSRIVRAVADGQIDVALAWGPLAGYFATRVGRPLEVVPLEPEVDEPFLPFAFDISMGVRRGEEAFRARLDEILDRRRGEIDRILADYAVPRVDHGAIASAGGTSR